MIGCPLPPCWGACVPLYTRDTGCNVRESAVTAIIVDKTDKRLVRPFPDLDSSKIHNSGPFVTPFAALKGSQIALPYAR